MHEAGAGNLAKHVDNIDSKEYRAIILVLNAYEFAATGVREGAFDEMTFKRLRCGIVLRDWNALCGFVLEFRRKKAIPTIFQEFEWLARRWQANPLKEDIYN